MMTKMDRQTGGHRRHGTRRKADLDRTKERQNTKTLFINGHSNLFEDLSLVIYVNGFCADISNNNKEITNSAFRVGSSDFLEMEPICLVFGRRQANLKATYWSVQ